MEQHPGFEARKRDHLKISLEDQAQASEGPGLDQIELIHDALPELNFSEIQIQTKTLGQNFSAPYFVSSMTAGHLQGQKINQILARFCQERGLLMGVGSQRRELLDPGAAQEWKAVRQVAPKARLAGNLGLAQLIVSPVDRVLSLIDSLDACALFIHTNPLQEVIQPEGTPQFRGGVRALEALVKKSPVPVILKEVGCGMSESTFSKIDQIGLAAVDVSGRGGTHWGRVEAMRMGQVDFKSRSAWTFADWGLSTVDSLVMATSKPRNFQIWASGGVRHGLDIAKLLAMGAQMVGLAQPWLKAATSGDPERALFELSQQLDEELKTAMFCMGSVSSQELTTAAPNHGRWKWRKN